MIILGIASYHPDASAAIIRDGEIIAAVDEERLNRIKHSPGFPEHAVRYCLEKAGVSLEDVDFVAAANDLKKNILRKIAFSLRTFPVEAWPKYLSNYMSQRVMRPLSLAEDLAKRVGGDAKRIQRKIRRVEHHSAHAASVYYASPFKEASILTLDGSGDFVTSALSHGGGGGGGGIKRVGEVYWPNSLGMLYFSVTQYLGFHEIGAEGKVMALASYGKPKYMDEFRKIVRLTADSFRMDMSYFTFHLPVLIDNWGDPTTSQFFIYRDWLSEKFHAALGPARVPESVYTERHMDIAATLQKSLEETAFHLMRRLHRETKADDLCLAGGVALNCVMNGKVMEHTPFKRVYVQPNAGDGGLSMGSALSLYNSLVPSQKRTEMRSASLGTEYTNGEVEAALKGSGLKYSRVEDVSARSASEIAGGKIIGWFQGKMEFGPRALGNRSILADPRSPEMRDYLNFKVKRREFFRPFAPSVLEEEAKAFFSLNGSSSPFMLLAVRVLPEKAALVPAITHVDGTARVQTVDKTSNVKYRRLIEEFRRITGVPMVLNTSFNLRGEPVVSSPADAIKTFSSTKIDVLAIEDFIVEK